MTGKGGEAWAAGWLSNAPTNWSSNKIIQQTKAGSRVSLAKAAAVAAATAADAVEAAVAAAAALAEAEATEVAVATEAAEAAEAVEALEAEVVEATEAAAAPNWLSNVFNSQSRAAIGEGAENEEEEEGGGGGGGSASAVVVKVTIVTNSPIFNKFISGYIRGETGFSIQNTTAITFSTGSTAAVFVLLVEITQKLEFEIIVANDLKFNSFVFGNDYETDGRVTYTTKTNNVIRAIVTPYEIDGELESIFAELEISLSNEIVITPDELITQTVTKSVFELVESGLTLCQIEVLKKERLNEILNNIENLRNYSRTSGVSTTYNNNGSLNQAGATYTENFPSAKFSNNVSMNELLLTKKNYMFSNSLNKNVTSGSIGFNSSNSSPYIAGSSSGLTKVQQYANAAKGRSPSGGVGRRYGVQFFDGRSLVSIPNIYDRFNRSNQSINLCALGN